MSDSIQSILDASLVKKNAESTREPIVSPSCLGDCIRKLMMLERKYPARPFEPIQLRTFKAGYLFEEFVLNTLEKEGVLVKRQEAVEYRGIKGTLDSVISLNGENVLFDVKSIKSSAFGYLDKEGVGEKYTYQLSFYHLALAKKLKISNLARVFYVEKENLMIKELALVCPDHYAAVEQKITEVEVARKAKELPPERNTAGDTFPCYSVNKKFKTCKSYCQYSDHCPKIVAEMEAVKKGFGK
jgi:hypothetical protein